MEGCKALAVIKPCVCAFRDIKFKMKLANFKIFSLCSSHFLSGLKYDWSHATLLFTFIILLVILKKPIYILFCEISVILSKLYTDKTFCDMKVLGFWC